MFTEGGIRVPLIAWMPGRIPAGATNDSSVNMVDFHPTLADFAGAKLPDAARQPLDGVSLRPLLEGRTQTLAPRALYWHFPGYLDDRAEPTSMVLRDLDGKRWKLLYFYESRRWSLYNLTDDPGESVDVIAATTAGPQGKALAVLSDDLHQWLDRTGAIFPIELSTGKPVPPPSPAR
jgi:arylsulfatase A-like enzyme